MDKIDSRGVAYVNWPQQQDVGMSYGVQAEGIRIYMKCREDSLMFSWMSLPFHPGDGPESAQLFMVCPHCGAKDLRIPGHAKTFQWELLPFPRHLQVPGNADAVQTIRLTVLEPCGCPDCRRMFKITDNVVHKA